MQVELGAKGDAVLYRTGPGAMAVDGELAVKKLKAEQIFVRFMRCCIQLKRFCEYP